MPFHVSVGLHSLAAAGTLEGSTEAYVDFLVPETVMPVMAQGVILAVQMGPDHRIAECTVQEVAPYWRELVQSPTPQRAEE